MTKRLRRNIVIKQFPWLLSAIFLVGSGRAQDPGPAVRAVNEFGWDLHRMLAGTDGNVVFSPYSIGAALGMTRVGAAGETGVELDKVLHFPPGGPDSSWRDLTAALVPKARPRGRGDEAPSYQFETANALFVQEGAAFESRFSGRVKDLYDSGFRPVDFRRAEEARQAINLWVNQRTHERIPEILAPGTLSAEMRVVLANAVWFKAMWTKQFSEKGTKDEDFHVTADRKVTAKMMHRVGECRYGETALAQVLDLSYGQGETGFLVVLPKSKHGLGEVASKENPSSWVSALDEKLPRVDIKIPRFTFSSGYELGPPLKSMGMQRAFDPKAADFSAMCKSEPFHIGLVIHKAFIAVDEEGTEASAATVVALRAGARPNTEEPIPFVADHPFLFFIRHRPTGTILFCGRVTDPTAAAN